MITVVAGCTGLTGKLLVQELLNDPSITKVIAVARRDLPFHHAKLATIKVEDLDDMPHRATELAGDAYFCCLGTTIKAAGSQAAFSKVDHDAVVAFAQIAKEHKAQAFVLVSAMGANDRSMIFYNRVKGQMEADVARLGLRSLSIFRPALLAGRRDEPRPGEGAASALLVPLSRMLGPRMGKLIVTDASVLAHKMLAAAKLQHPGTHIVSASTI